MKETKYKNYYADEYGNIYSNVSGKIIQLKPMNSTWGYYMVSIKKKKVKVHKLIAETFIPNPNNKPCIDHIDGDKHNNAVYNLRWATHKQNSNNPITKQKMKTIYDSQEYKDKMKAIYDSKEYKEKWKNIYIQKLICAKEQSFININNHLNFDITQKNVKFFRTKEYRYKMSLAKRKYNYQYVKQLISNKGQKTWDNLSMISGIPTKTLKNIRDKLFKSY